MRKNSTANAGIFSLRGALALVLCAAAAFCGTVSLRARPKSVNTVPDGNWSVVHSADMLPQALYGVSCLSQSDCWAVGFAWNADEVRQTLTEHWNGSAWTVVPSANVNATAAHRLRDVSCVSGSDCWAVGYIGISATHTLVEHWNGNAWVVVAAPDPASNAVLFGVSCVSSNDCWAVGSSSIGGLAEHWDGNVWSIVAMPDADQGGLSDVTCTSTINCWAVGSSSTGTLTERWNGVSWSVVSSPNTSPTAYNDLSSVSCSSVTDCWAVGSSFDNGLEATLAEHWDGNSWTIVSSPNDDVEDSLLLGVSCVSSSDCWAVGSTDTFNYTFNDRILIEHWNGVSWSMVAAPPGATGDTEILLSVACTSGSHCWAAGYINLNTPVIDEWNGASWTRAQAPRVDGPGVDSLLYDTTCVSATNCWAVGYSGSILQVTLESPPPPDFSLIQHWDGNAWSVVPSSNDPLHQQSILRGVTCASSTDCWAVGYKGFESKGETLDFELLVEHWDGSRWSIVSAPDPVGANASILLSVACASTSDCWAVGYYYDYDIDAGIAHTLIEHWNGAAWSIVSDPTPQNHDHVLSDVACNPASDCWAVGHFAVNDSKGYHWETLLEHWNGTMWSIVPRPEGLVSNSFNYADDVTCTSASDCWVAGFFDSTVDGPTEFAHWNGLQWSTVPEPLGKFSVNGLACASSTNCWAVGTDYTADQHQPFTEHWDGIAWSVVPSPAVNSIPFYENELDAVACSPDSRCTAVGFYAVHDPDPQTAVQYRTLAEEFTPIPELMNVVSRKTHGAATFDIDLLTDGTGIECRSGGANGDYTIVFNFANTLSSVDAVNVTSGTGSITSSSIGADTHQFLVNLTGVTNAQSLTVSLNNARDSEGNIGSAMSATLGVLVGDTTGNGSVNSIDIVQMKSLSGQSLTNLNFNFRSDLNTDGAINSADLSLMKSKSGTALPSPQFRAAHSEGF